MENGKLPKLGLVKVEEGNDRDGAYGTYKTHKKY
jgi:hypothetical protein